MKQDELGKHIKQIRGISYKKKEILDYTAEGYVPIIKANNITEDGFENDDLIYIHQGRIRPEQYVRKGDLILAASSGSKKVIGKNIHFSKDFVGSFGAFCKLIRPLKTINDSYLKHFFKTPYYRKTIQRVVQGANINNLKNEHLNNMRIPVPANYDDQTRIATLLSKVESLIARRKKSIADLDELLKSTFGEMFSIKNDEFKKWEIDKLAKHSEIVSGVAKGKKYKKTRLIEVPYLRVANVQDGFFDLAEVKTIFVSEREIDQCQLRKDDILLTEGGDPDKLGRGSVWNGQIEPCIHQNHIFRVRINNKKIINPVFLSGLIGSIYGKTYFLKSAKQTTGIASINSTQLKNFPVILPPINLQNKFASIVEKVEALKGKYQDSLKDLETLYGALSQKAFKGELDLSRIPLVVNLKPKDITTAKPYVGEPTLSVQDQPVKTPESREQILHQLFNLFLSGAKSKSISLDDFWLEAEEKFLDLMDEDAPPLGIADYDRVRALLFDLLASGKIAQVFNEQENRMEIRTVS